MIWNTAHEPGPLEVRASEERWCTIVRITARGEALAAPTSAIFSDVAQPARRALLEQLRAIIVQVDRQTQRWRAPEYCTTEAPRRARPADRW